jgi:hypothetical protein
MGYSPPKGRSPTCYSPVRHSHEAPKSPTPVRLACLIRAASVRSEPGSNSPSYLVASHSEEQKAHLLDKFQCLLDFSSLDPHCSLSLDPYLSLPSLFVKNTPPKPSAYPAAVFLAAAPFTAFKELLHPPHQTTSLRPLGRKGEFTSLKDSMSSTNAKINLSFNGIIKRSLRRA